jgi:epsilon-lactone hydrolase
MPRIDHELHPDDESEMNATRAYLALQPKLAIVPEARDGFAALMGAILPAGGVTFEPAVIRGISGWWCIPTTPKPGVAILHLHGGGYVLGSASSHRPFISHLAQSVGASVFIPDYSLAPERPFPAALEDARASMDGLLSGDIRKVAVTGDSAGGGLALALAQSLTADTAIAGVVAFSPWTDLTLTAASMEHLADVDPLLSRAALSKAADLYVGLETDRRDPRVSPRYGSKKGMPPVMIHVGADEVLRDDATGYGEAAEADRTRVDVHVWAGMTHVFPSSVATLHAAREALELSASFLRNCLERGVQ